MKTMGLDLSENYDDIAKIVTSKFGHRTKDVEDLIQEVCYKIHRLNMGKSPYDPSKSSVSSYVYMVADGLLKKRWHKSNKDPLSKYIDIEDLSGDLISKERPWESVYFSDLEARLAACDPEALKVMRLVKMGYSRDEIVETTQLTEYRVRKARVALRGIISKDGIN